MTYLGNPKADHGQCQIRECSLPTSHPRPVVHSESNAIKTQVLLVPAKANRMVHFKARSAL